MAKFLNIYHGNCADGFTSAWVVRQAFSEGKICTPKNEGGNSSLEHFPGVYSKPAPLDLCKGTHVIVTDFSYSREAMLEISKVAATLTIIDHHETAIKNLEKLEDDVYCPYFPVFDMKHSGAMLAWMYYFHHAVPPALIKHVEDRDLWRFALKGTRSIQANIFSYPYEFPVWDELVERVQRDAYGFEKEGDAIERKHFKDIRELLGVCTRMFNIGGYRVPTANLPYTLASDAGNIMCKEHKDAKFAACFYQNAEGNYVFSLRSVGDFNVATVAAKYKGGGHKNAAGFTISWELLGADEIIPSRDHTQDLD